jgi:polar amino acid transport system substrate-binding protein
LVYIRPEASRIFPAATVLELPTWDDVIAGLLAAKVEAIYCDEFEIRGIVKNNPALSGCTC